MASYSLTVAVGAFVLYSQTTVLRIGKALPIGAGAFATSGQAVALTWRQRASGGVFTLNGQAVNFIAPGSVSYATIVDGRVTAVSAGSLPASTLTTYYHVLLGGDPVPAVGDYFSDVCGTFSATAPVIPAGDIAPPYTPGGTPPDPDDPDYPEDEIPPEDDQDIRSHVLPDLITWAADADGLLTISAVPIAVTSLGDKYHLAYDFTEVCYMRLQAEVITPASAGAVLKLQYYDATQDPGEEWVDLEYAAPIP
jgi:hypothetical protein